MAFRCTIPVRFGDCDVAKIVYYPRILHFCHVTMEELFAHVAGVPYHRAVLEEHVGYPAVRLDAEYREPVRMGTVLEMTAVVERLGGRSVDFRFEGRRQDDGVLAFVARVRTVAVDMQDWKSRDIPAHHRAALETLGV